MSVTGGAIPSCNWRRSFGRCANIFIASRASAPCGNSQCVCSFTSNVSPSGLLTLSMPLRILAFATSTGTGGHGSSGSISTREGNPKTDHEPICPSRFRINALLSSSATIRYYTKSYLSASLPLSIASSDPINSAFAAKNEADAALLPRPLPSELLLPTFPCDISHLFTDNHDFFAASAR